MPHMGAVFIRLPDLMIGEGPGTCFAKALVLLDHTTLKLMITPSQVTKLGTNFVWEHRTPVSFWYALKS